MIKQELFDKTKDVVELFKTDEMSMEDAQNHVYVLAKKLAKQQMDNYLQSIVEFVNENIDLDEEKKKEVVFAIKKTPLPEFE